VIPKTYALARGYIILNCVLSNIAAVFFERVARRKLNLVVPLDDFPERSVAVLQLSLKVIIQGFR
jgi:hypothetical protein